MVARRRILFMATSAELQARQQPGKDASPNLLLGRGTFLARLTAGDGRVYASFCAGKYLGSRASSSRGCPTYKRAIPSKERPPELQNRPCRQMSAPYKRE